MKQYQVTLKDQREVLIYADSHKHEGINRMFYKEGKVIPDVLVREDQVVAITISDDGNDAYKAVMC